MDPVEINGRDIEIRGLTRKEVRDLEPYGFSCLACVPVYETADQAMEKVFDLVLSREDRAFLDDCPNSDSITVWKEILKETYGSRTEEKNLSSTSAGTATGNG